MKECDRLVAMLVSLQELIDAAASKSTLKQLLTMAYVETSECLVRAGFEAEKLAELGVADEVGYFLDAKYRDANPQPGSAGARARGGPHLRLVGA
jgi:hypothetical protein